MERHLAKKIAAETVDNFGRSIGQSQNIGNYLEGRTYQISDEASVLRHGTQKQTFLKGCKTRSFNVCAKG
jgi:hypothetical protein